MKKNILSPPPATSIPRFSRSKTVYKTPQPTLQNHKFLTQLLLHQLLAVQLRTTDPPLSFDSIFSQEAGKMSRPGDWNCRSCQHLNFQRRDSCQRCGEPKPGERGDYGSFGGRGSSTFGFTGPDVRPGDWYCTIGNCGAHNFASRSSCFKCGAFKDESPGGYEGDMSRTRGFGFGGGSSGSSSSRSGWKSGDWICTRSGCNEHNFASRMECFRCNAPRESGNKSSYSS